MRLNCISSCCCSYFHLSHIDGIGGFCTGSQVSNLASRFNNLGFLFCFTGGFIYDRFSTFVKDIISYFTVCTAYRNGSICGYPCSIIFIRAGMLFPPSVIASRILIILTCISARYGILTNSNSIIIIIFMDDGIFSQHRRISQSTKSQQSGDDGSYGRLTKISLPVYICTYKFTLTGRFVLAFR